MSEMFNPPHPGRVLKSTVCREDGGISVTDFALGGCAGIVRADVGGDAVRL
jgi:hypothetical protein